MAPLPDVGTDALLEYSWANVRNLCLFSFVIDTTLRGDFVAYVAKQALDGKQDYKEQDPAELAKRDPGPSTQALRRHSQELLEMFVSRIVDNFEVYLVKIIRLVLHSEPRILSDRKKELTLGDILKFDSIDALSRDIIEGKVAALSQRGFGEIESWCAHKSIPLVVPFNQRQRVVELIALRNIIVHNRGYVDERYRTAVSTSPHKLGEKKQLNVDDLFAAVELLDSVANATDAAVSTKYRLSTVNVHEEIMTRSAELWPDPVEAEQQLSADNAPEETEC